MCGENILKVKRAVSMSVAAKARSEKGEQNEAMQRLVLAISEGLEEGHDIEEIEIILKGGV